MLCISHAIALITKWPNLKLKTRPKQLLGYLLLAFTLPDQSLHKHPAALPLPDDDAGERRVHVGGGQRLHHQRRRPGHLDTGIVRPRLK